MVFDDEERTALACRRADRGDAPRQYRHSFIRELSTGTRRVVDLACQVAHRPTVILLDEPSSGIAQREVEALSPVLLRLRDEMGASAGRHRARHAADLEHLRPADRARPGRVIATGRPADVLLHPDVVRSYLGTDASALAALGRPPAAVSPTSTTIPTRGVIHATGAADPAGSSGGNRQLKRWGPIVGVLVAVVVGSGARSRGDDDDESSTTTTQCCRPAVVGGGRDDTVAPTRRHDTRAPTTTPRRAASAPGTRRTYPLSFVQAEEQGLADQIDWGDRCDTSTGRLAVPDFFAPACMAPFTGDNGGETDQGVTADEITVVYYEGQEADPIIAYITDAINVDDTNGEQFDTMERIIDFYETYFELYGRTVNLVTFEGTGGSTDDVAARADAARIAEEYKPFVVLGGPALTSGFADELAAREIMCIGCTPGQPSQFYVDRDPVRVGDRRQPGAEAGPLGRVPHQAADRQERRSTAATSSVDQPRKFGLVYLESSAASKELADSIRRRDGGRRLRRSPRSSRTPSIRPRSRPPRRRRSRG